MGIIIIHHEITIPTVDGRNPAPDDMVNIPLFTDFYTSKRWLALGFQNHQQYWLVVEPTHLKNMLVKLDHVPKYGGKTKNI